MRGTDRFSGNQADVAGATSLLIEPRDRKRSVTKFEERSGHAPRPVPQAASLGPEAIIALQRTAGNAAVTAALRGQTHRRISALEGGPSANTKTSMLLRQDGGVPDAGAPVAGTPPPAPVVTTGAPVAGATGGAPSTGSAAPAAPSRATPTDFKSDSEIDSLTLSGFHAYAEGQADWALSPTLTEARKSRLRTLLEFARAELPEQPVLRACGGMRVSDLVTTGLGEDVRAPLRTYSHAHTFRGRSVEVERTDSVATALAQGQALAKLERTPGPAIINTTIKQGPGGHQLQDLIDAGAVDDFIHYVRVAHPLLMATNGAEIDSYLALRAEGDPASFAGRIHHVRNFHRFHKVALEALATNETDTGKTKPFTLVLHTAIDHNGAFHRDPNMRDLITNSHNLTLMIEGATTLSEIGHLVHPLAERYGRGNRIEQVHIAGHGESQVMELAADRDAFGRMHEEDLERGAPGTTRLLGTLLDNMSSTPDARIVLNACLTNSRVVSDPLDPDPAVSRPRLVAALAAEPSLAEDLRAMAAARGIGPGQVLAANASFGQVELIDPGTGRLTLRDPDDPALTVPDKLQYIRTGSEPTGAMRAVVQMWASDQAGTERAMRDHLGTPESGIWNERVTRAMFEISLRDMNNVQVMNQLAQAALGVSELTFEDECRVDRIADVPAALRDPLFSRLVSATAWTSTPRIRLVVLQVWMRSVSAKEPDFLTALTSFTCSTGRVYVDLAGLPSIPRLLGLSPPEGALRVALLDAALNADTATDASKVYLRGIRGSRAHFPDPARIDAALGGLSTVGQIEDAIREPDTATPPPSSTGSPPPGPPPEPDFNVDLDGDGTNDFYVAPTTHRGAVAATLLNVRERPGLDERRVDVIPQGTRLNIVGTSGEWYAVEWGGHTRFVHQTWVTLRPSL